MCAYFKFLVMTGFRIFMLLPDELIPNQEDICPAGGKEFYVKLEHPFL